MEQLFGSALGDRPVVLDVVPQLAAGGVLYYHVHVCAPVDRLVHAQRCYKNAQNDVVCGRTAE